MSGRNPKFKVDVEVLGDLPYYVPMPEGVVLKQNIVGGEYFEIDFTHFKPLRHPEDSHGENVDDHIGTFIRSRIRVIFTLSEIPNEDQLAEYKKKALCLANRALLAIRYVAADPAIRFITDFDKCIAKITKSDLATGKIHPVAELTYQENFGPFGITMRGELNSDTLQRLWWVFEGLSPANPAWHLILDAKYHAAVGDLSRAILDISTALEINVEQAIRLYAWVDPALSRIEFDRISVYDLYDKVLLETIGHSLHERPELFAKLEYIRELRNSIAHTWKPEFHISSTMRKYSRYLEQHRALDGHVVTDKEEVTELIRIASEIISYVLVLYKNKYKK